MKRILLILFCLILLVGCSSNQQSAKPKNGVITMPYEKPVDFKHFEVFISLTPNFKPTGWDGSKWTGQPNAPSEWNGADKTLFMVTTNDPIQVTGLTPGKTYYVQVVVVDTSNQRSIPSPEIEAVAGDAQRSSTLVVAASDSSPASKAGADFVCDGIDDQDTINEAINALIEISPDGGTLSLSDGTYILNGSVKLISNLSICGQGPNTVLKLQNGYNKAIDMINADGISNAIIKDLLLDGNKDAQTYIYRNYHNLIYIVNCSQIAIENLVLKNSLHVGVYLKESTECYISKNTIEDNGWYAVQIDSCNNISIISGNTIRRNCLERGNMMAAINMTGAVNNVIVNGNQIYENDVIGIVVIGDNISIINNSIFNNGGEGIKSVSINTSNVDIKNNQLHSNGWLNNNTFAQISFMYGSYINIQANTCRQGSLENKPQGGIAIGSMCNYALVSNNDCYQAGLTYGITNVSSTTNFGSGNRNNDGTWSTTPN